ncbi:hypothetical protein Dsin_009661 [Dipteronia sinensis]|uniref:Uncharacterized protein n=1 Tax=Dipteronia sinensis TaxID=43782 RepID=A0AAE0EBY5_9ROSI|nr:hypothetical protein Dsin_009661 [Dipteronia sinensis]
MKLNYIRRSRMLMFKLLSMKKMKSNKIRQSRMLLSLNFRVTVAIAASLMPDKLPFTTVACIPNLINTGNVTFDFGAEMTFESVLVMIIEGNV